MTLLELAAGLIFVRGMNVKLWDYSKKPFNYKGIVCLEFSIYWLVLSAVYYVMIHPLMIDFTDILISNQACLYPLGILSGVFVTDVCYSIQIAAKIKSFAAENNILIKYEELKFNIRKYAEEQKEKYWFIFAFSSKITLNEHLKKYLETASPIKRLKRMVKQGRKQQEDVYESGNKNF